MEVLAQCNDGGSADGIQHHSGESQVPSTAVSSPSPSTTSSATASAASQEALAACQTLVRAADDVLKQGKIGVENWTEHVQAQKDYNAGKATTEEMKARFKKTRLRGPMISSATTRPRDVQGPRRFARKSKARTAK